MTKENWLNCPEHVKDLLQPTPSSVAKLLAAWDDLCLETQILILSNLDDFSIAPNLEIKIKTNALDSKNSYIRYLAASDLLYLLDDPVEQGRIKQIIASDSDPLVNNLVLEGSSIRHSYAIDAFLEYSQEARLAVLRRSRGFYIGAMELVGNLLEKVITEKLLGETISETELYEILQELLNDAEFRRIYVLDIQQQTSDREVEWMILRLWAFIPYLPERIAIFMIRALPKPLYETSVTAESMTDDQLMILLRREDMILSKLRKKVFWDSGENKTLLKAAAASSHFSVTHDDFAKIIMMGSQNYKPILTVLNDSSALIDASTLNAIHDVLYNSDLGLVPYAIYPPNVENRINELKGVESQYEKELTDLRLYKLASLAVPWRMDEYEPSGKLTVVENESFFNSGKYEFPEALNFLSEYIVSGDTWATFMAFADAWSNRPSDDEAAANALSLFYKPDEN